MTATLASSHPERMSGYGSSLDMDPVHTPARYIALLSIHYRVLRCFTDTIMLSEVMYFPFVIPRPPASARRSEDI